MSSHPLLVLLLHIIAFSENSGNQGGARVMREYVLFTAVVATLCAGAFATAQTAAEKQNPTQTRPTTQTEASPNQPATTTTLVGCLYHERDVPGRQPNVAERAGVLEDYILADATTAAQPGATTPGATGTTGTVPAKGKMYKVEKIADERLRALVGKRVEVTGRIDAERGDVKGTGGAAVPQPDRGPGRDQIELPEFEATSIREVPGTCPAKPTP